MIGLHNKKALTIVEMAAVMGIVILLSAVIFAVLVSPGDHGRQAACGSNLRSINAAIRMYYNDKGFSPATLAELTRDYGLDQRSLKCPSGHSYEQLYLSRDLFRQGEPGLYSMAYMAGCPWHADGQKSVVMLLDGSANVVDNYEAVLGALAGSVSVRRRDAETFSAASAAMKLGPGDIVQTAAASSAVLTFEDGSSLNIGQETAVMVMQTHVDERLDSRCHSVVYVNGAGAFDAAGQAAEEFEVEYVRNAPGSTYFEIATPALIAGIRGTRLQISRLWKDKELTESVKVFEASLEPVTVFVRTSSHVSKLETGEQKDVVTFVKEDELPAAEVEEKLTGVLRRLLNRLWLPPGLAKKIVQ